MMNCIENAIINNRHKTDIDELRNQNWDSFFRVSKDKDIYIFGLGEGAHYLIKTYKDMPVAGVVDNDSKKHGISVNSFYGGLADNIYGNMSVMGIAGLNNVDKDNVVVLITSLMYYEQIYLQLKDMGIKNVYSMLIMEAELWEHRTYDEEYDMCEEKTHNSEVDSKKIVFYGTSGYSGHGKYIIKEILKRRCDLDIVWISNDMSIEVPDGVRPVYAKNRDMFIHEMETATIWVFDNMVPKYIEKKKGQIYIQVKHWPSVTLKAFGLDTSTYRGEEHISEWERYNGDMMDYVIVGSEFDEKTCRSGLGFDKEFIHAGSCRTDIFFENYDYRSKIYRKYNIDNDVSTVLYAPTFRCKEGETFKPEAAGIDIDCTRLVSKLENITDKKWKIMLRLHPFVATERHRLYLGEEVVDVTDYPDCQELIAASDMLITDYSNVMFEAIIADIPVLLLAYDRDKYIDGERKLLISYDKLPFSISESDAELEKAIESFDIEEYRKKVKMFLEEYGVHEDGHASERVAEFILKKLAMSE